MCVICFFLVCEAEPRGLIARRVAEVAQSTLDMVSTAVDYPLCECLQSSSTLQPLTSQGLPAERDGFGCGIFRFCEGRSQARLLGPRPGHHSVPPVLQNLHGRHVKAPLQGLWTGRVWPLLQTHQARSLPGLGPPGQSV